MNITTSESFGYGKFYVSDNFTEGSLAISADNWNGGVDTDLDGMPDDWELRKDLDPDDSTDRAIYGLSPEYTNLEVYINSIVETTCK